MITDNSSLTETNQDAERRRVLAKVYGLLIRLAVQAESADVSPSTPIPEENEKQNDVTLKKNIPP